MPNGSLYAIIRYHGKFSTNFALDSARDNLEEFSEVTTQKTNEALHSAPELSDTATMLFSGPALSSIE